MECIWTLFSSSQGTKAVARRNTGRDQQTTMTQTESQRSNLQSPLPLTTAAVQIPVVQISSCRRHRRSRHDDILYSSYIVTVLYSRYIVFKLYCSHRMAYNSAPGQPNREHEMRRPNYIANQCCRTFLVDHHGAFCHRRQRLARTQQGVVRVADP